MHSSSGWAWNDTMVAIFENVRQTANTRAPSRRPAELKALDATQAGTTHEPGCAGPNQFIEHGGRDVSGRPGHQDRRGTTCALPARCEAGSSTIRRHGRAANRFRRPLCTGGRRRFVLTARALAGSLVGADPTAGLG